MSIELKEAEIKNILAEVTASLQAAKKSEAEKLSKALDGEGPPAEEPVADESAAPAAPEASESAPAVSPEMSDAPPAESAPAEGAPAESAPVDPAAASADPAAGAAGPVDPAMLAQEYAKLDDEQLKAHYMAAKQAVFERMQGAASAGAPPPDAASAASAAPAASAVGSPPAAGASPAMKGELAADGNVAPVTKPGSQKLDQATGSGASLSAKQSPVSEASHAGLKVEKEVAKSESDLIIEGLVKAVNLLANPPQNMRKAVTSVAYLERTEAMEKSEKPVAKKVAPEDMKAHLSEAIRSGKLSKAEKAAVLSFYETKNPIHLEKLQHLFE